MFRKRKVYIIEVEVCDENGKLINRWVEDGVFKKLSKVYNYLKKKEDKPIQIARLTYKSSEYTYAILEMDLI